MLLEAIDAGADFLNAALTTNRPKYALILGSGLNEIVDNELQSWDYKEVPGFLISTAPSHKGRLILGQMKGIDVIILQGRWHYYEGYDMSALTLPIRILKQIGVDNLLITNISGSLNPNYKVGDCVALKDHINLFPANPLRGKNLEDFGPRFPDMSEVYDSDYRRLALKLARAVSLPMHEGVYVGLQGPNFETPAESRFLRSIGGDVVGMSSVPEAIVAKHCGMRIFTLSLISNVCAAPHDEAKFLETIQIRLPQIKLFLSKFVNQLDQT